MELRGQWRCAAGSLCQQSKEIRRRYCGELAVNRNTAILWRKRFSEGLDGRWDSAPGRGRKPTYETDKVAAIVDAILQTE
jgi:hypothetical protein